MNRPDHRLGARRRLALITVSAVLALAAAIPVGSVAAAEPADTVLNWNMYAVQALSNPADGTPAGAGQTPAVGSLHLAMVQAAVYDAVNAIDRTHEPYLRGLPRAPRSASKAAAAATAAHHVLVGLVPALADNVKARLDGLYKDSLATIKDGKKKTAGIKIGAAVAKAMLAKRAKDGRYVPFAFTVGSDAGEWRPDLPLFVNDPNAWVSNVKPFALRRASQVRTRGPLDVTSKKYTAEFNEVKLLGSSTTVRSAAQLEFVRFFSASPLPMMNAAFRQIAATRHLSISKSARLFGMLSVAGADAFIGCWDDKDHHSFWRPITAIRNATTDGNAATIQQDDWLPFLPTPPYPDHPSGYNCYTAAMMYTAKSFFGTDRVRISLTSPVTTTTRTYNRMTVITRDTIDARVFQGIHFRTADVQGVTLGRNVANWVTDHYFERDDD